MYKNKNRRIGPKRETGARLAYWWVNRFGSSLGSGPGELNRLGKYLWVVNPFFLSFPKRVSLSFLSFSIFCFLWDCRFLVCCFDAYELCWLADWACLCCTAGYGMCCESDWVVLMWWGVQIRLYCSGFLMPFDLVWISVRVICRCGVWMFQVSTREIGSRFCWLEIRVWYCRFRPENSRDELLLMLGNLCGFGFMLWFDEMVWKLLELHYLSQKMGVWHGGYIPRNSCLNSYPTHHSYTQPIKI